MQRYILLASSAACFCLGVVVPLKAAPAPNDSSSASNPAATCLADVRSFNGKLEKDGYWLGGSDYGYGYPMGGIGYFGGGYADDYDGAYPLANRPGYRNARPGYEIRVLLASANILAKNGQQQGCEDILGTTRAIYKIYVADIHERGLRPGYGPDRQQKEITAAQPVNAGNTTFRSDELIDTGVRSIRNDGLGSIEDLVTDPKTGKIAYLVVARGGIFGFDKTYVPVPWDDFKITQGTKLLVLDTTTAIMQAAPAVNRNEAYTPAQFKEESQKVDAYWTAHMPPNHVN